MMERKTYYVYKTNSKRSKAWNARVGFKAFFHGVAGRRNGVGVILGVMTVRRVSDSDVCEDGN